VLKIDKQKTTKQFIYHSGLIDSRRSSYRKLDQLLSFSEISKPYLSLYSVKGRKEKGVEFGLRALVLQFLEDLSDREMERYLKENIAGKWFCELHLEAKGPDHSYFGEFRKRLGTERLMELFSQVRDGLREMGLIKEVFTFVDASQLVSKLTTWESDQVRSGKIQQ